ncbi:MAG: PKD domain-containing protein, partial [Mucilaginibacter sp.]
RDTVKANFAVADPDICGNNFVTFTNLTPFDDYYAYLWDFGDNQTGTTSWNQGYTSIAHQYQDKGTFTIRLIATNGICSDTIVRTDYVKISPPFPKISSFTNTCDGTRGEVTFNQASTQVISGTWNFGDGSTAPYVDQPQIKHTYNKTGFYKVVLTTSNGRCTVADSTFITVLLKQHPVLSGDKTVLCSRDDFLQLTYSSLEVNPSPYGTGGYGFGGWYHSDDTYAIGHVSAGDLSQIPFVMSVWDFTPGTGLYSMVTSSTFGCVDTTNLIPLTIKGPVAGFKQDKPDPCGGSNTVILEDTSKSRFGVALVLWEWNFGDGQKQTYNQGGKITHTYNYPGNYPVYLTVTDADGCHDYFQNFADAITNSLQASFDPSLTTISPGSSVTFTNTSQSSDADNTTYKWLFGDGSEALTTDAVKTFSVPGKYLVQLVAYNNLKGCRDTAFTTITVKYVNAAFAVNSSYIGGSKCPPVVVSFTNTSSNVSSIYWDFGDGSIAANVFNPSHVYTKAGKYIVQVTTYSDNGTKYVTKDSVVIEQPSVATKVNLLHSCTAQSITFTAIAKNVSSYLWDFGDGSIIKVTDAVAIHNYPAAGIYIPHIIITDSNGCSTSVNAADTIIIDSLNVSLPGIPAKICAPKEIVFNPAIISISGNQAPGSLTFHWDFGTGNARDTSREKNASFLYQQPGNYPVRLQVNSAYGCVQVVTKTITASQGLTPYITGPPEICQNTSATFKGNTQIPGQPQWLWIFENGTTAHQQNPPAKAYNNPGSFPVILVVDNN